MRHRKHSPARLHACLMLWVALLGLPETADAQSSMDDAREALAAGQARRAVGLLEEVVRTAPTPDAYLYLGVALANVRETARALEVLTEGSTRYPDDSRFHGEIAGVHLAGRNVDLATEALERAIQVDPGDAYASDLLASIRLSEGDVREALAIWNVVGQPEIDRISQNFAPGILDRTVPRALAFEPGDTLGYAAWETTEARLFASRLYSNVGLELEPSPREARFNAIVNTSAHRNTRNDILVDLVRGFLVETTYFDYWDIARTGVSWRSRYRWDKDRRQLRGQVVIPLPLPGLPVLELGDTWRWERWNLDRPIRPAFIADALFDYKVNALAFNVGVTPHYRVELHGGLEYRNRDVTGTIGVLGMDQRNSGTLSFGTVLRPVDRRYKNQIRLDAFVARDSLLGDFDFNGGTARFINRFEIRKSSHTLLDISLSGGTLRGNAPVDHYFILGLGSVTEHALRAHVASDGGRYGQAPMGTDFVLLNTDLEYRVATIPLFNTLSIPYIHVKAMAFFDSGKTFDRQRVFSQNVWYKDAGAGLGFETPTHSFTILYGRDFVGNEHSFYAYVEPNIW